MGEHMEFQILKLGASGEFSAPSFSNCARIPRILSMETDIESGSLKAALATTSACCSTAAPDDPPKTSPKEVPVADFRMMLEAL